MNKRIQELEKQSYTEVMHEMGGKYTTFDKEKFAELIVRECANRAAWAQDTSAVDIGGEVLKHFGVENE
jgi:hypothetical protein